MTNHFISNISIVNFKCFENLQVEGIERVNLIGGKNNVGKTAFLEAVELLVSSNESSDLVDNLYNLLKRRQNNNFSNNSDIILSNNSDIILGNSSDLIIDFIRENDTEVKISSTRDQNSEIRLLVQDDLSSEDITKLSCSINGDEKSLPINNLVMPHILMRNRDINNINFIGSATIKEQDIAILYGSLIDLDREDFLNDSLRKFDDNMLSIKQRAAKNHVILKLKLKDRQTPVLLSSLGDGVKRYITVLSAIWANKDGFLLIDEIENGIHYTNYKKLWQIIFQTSADANCQIFITSHSKECIEAFNEVQCEQEQNPGAYFEFYKNLKTDMITASKRHKEQLKYSLTHQGRLRGE